MRAHRGTKGKKDENRIYAKFVSAEMVDYVKSLTFVNKNIFMNQMRSPMVNARLFRGRTQIRTMKETDEYRGSKMYMNDRCQLMLKKPGTASYVKYKQF